MYSDKILFCIICGHRIPRNCSILQEALKGEYLFLLCYCHHLLHDFKALCLRLIFYYNFITTLVNGHN